MMMGQEVALKRFAWACIALQSFFAILFLLLVRYSPSARPSLNWRHPDSLQEELHENLEKYPLFIDVNMMVFGGFGLLMSFLKRYSFTSLGMTFFLTFLVSEWAIILQGLLRMDRSTFTINLEVLDLLEASLAAATVLISVGVMLGKLNPLQMLFLGLAETPVYVFNSYIGYKIFGANDAGGSIFIHLLGALFGMGLSLAQRRQNMEASEALEESSYTSDVLAMVGTIFLYVFWPSFNAVLAATGDGVQRAVINTVVSMIASGMAVFIVSSLMGQTRKFAIVDLQNATLSGGVAVGAVADLMVQPYTAFILGSIAGTVSTLGFRALQDQLYQRIGLHDTCGVLWLHGLPALISSMASVLVVGMANETTYGPSLYKLFPWRSPLQDSHEFQDLLRKYHVTGTELAPGDGRSAGMQAAFQLAGISATVLVALTSGYVTGGILNVKALFNPMADSELFDDAVCWTLPTSRLISARSNSSRPGRSSRSSSITHGDAYLYPPRFQPS